MKIAVGVAVFVWLVCGLIGDVMLEDGEDLRFKKIVRGPITLVEAINAEPVRYPEHA